MIKPLLLGFHTIYYGFRSLMMKKFLVSVAFVAAMVVTASPVEAGVFASAFQGITGARIKVSLDGGATFIDAVNNTHFTVLGSSVSSSAFAFLNGSSVFSPSGTLDSAPAYVGPGAGPGNDTAFGAGAAGTVPAGAIMSYAHADTGVDPLAGDLLTPPGGSALLTASTALGTIGDSSFGITNGTLTANVNTTIQPLVEALYAIQLDYVVTLVTDPLFGGTPGGDVFAESKWTLGVNGNGPGFSVDFSDSPVELNQVRAGGADYFGAGSLITNSVLLTRFGQFTVDINSTTAVRAAIVPEPTSIAIFSVLGITGFVARRRKMRQV